MRRWFGLVILSLLLGGCLFEGFSLPRDFVATHVAAVEPFTKQAVFVLTANQDRPEATPMRFVRIAPNVYAWEQFRTSNGKPRFEAYLARFTPLGHNWYLLHWTDLIGAQGADLVNISAGKMRVASVLDQQVSIERHAQANGFVAERGGGGTIALSALDDVELFELARALTRQASGFARLSTTELVSLLVVPEDRARAAYRDLGMTFAGLDKKLFDQFQSPELLIAYLEVLAAENNGWAEYALGRLFGNGWGVTRDTVAARAHAERAVALGVDMGHHLLGLYAYYGIDQIADPVKAVAHFNKAEAAGEARAAYMLGLAHASGNGVTKDRQLAEKWYERAIAGGRPEAYAALAELLLEDPKQLADARAIELLDKGVEAEQPAAMNLRAWLYSEGRGGPQNQALAADLAQQSALLGDAWGKYMAGDRLMRGEGVDADRALGERYLREAADAGIAQAAEALARAQQVPSDSTASSGACEEDWCKQALALTKEHLNQLGEKMARTEADIRRLDDEQAQRARQIDDLSRGIRDDTIAARKRIAKTLDMHIYNNQLELRADSLNLLDQLDRQPRLGAEQLQLRERTGAVLAKAQRSISKLEGEHPLIVAPRLANGQIAVMRADGQYVALALGDGTAQTPALDPANLPRPGDQLLPRAVETALVAYEEAWSDVPADAPEIAQAIAEINQMADGLDCQAAEFAGLALQYRRTENLPSLAADVSGTLRYRQQLGGIHNGQQSGYGETEEYAPLSRMAKIEVRPASGEHCASVILRCRDDSHCVVKTGNAPEVNTSRALSLTFMRTEQAQRAGELLGILVKRHAAPAVD